MKTAAAIKAAATEINKNFPEAAAEIAAGEVFIHVVVRANSGKRFSISGVPAVQLEKGNVEAGTPQTATWNRFNGRESAEDIGKKFAKRTFPELFGSVPVKVKTFH